MRPGPYPGRPALGAASPPTPWHHGLVPIEMDRERFEALVDEALDAIPDELASRVHNLDVLVADEPPAHEPADLLGLYDGVALTQRDSSTLMHLPDRVFVFRNPLLDMCSSEEELVEEVHRGGGVPDSMRPLN